MAREILFRGKTRDEKEWIEGFYAVFSNTPFIGAPNHYGTMLWQSVISKTVGQFTGYLDGTGQKIYEGDIVERTGLVCAIGIVRWYQGVCNFEFGEMSGDTFTGFAIKWIKGLLRCDIGHWHRDESVRVIGNIHDNPELLNGTES